MQVMHAQEIEMYNAGDDATISLKADPDVYASDALLYLHRADGLGKSQIKFDLNSLESGRQDAQLTEEFWNLGLNAGYKFQLEHYSSSQNLDGSLNTDIRSAIVVDHSRGREATFEVEIPQGILRIGNSFQIREESELTFIEADDHQSLKIAAGEILEITADEVEIEANSVRLPGAYFNGASINSNGNWTLGSYCSPWPEVWGDNYLVALEECERILYLSPLKSNSSTLNRLMGVTTVQGITADDNPVLKIEPTSFAQQFPEATYIENVISDDESGAIVKQAKGMKINVLIPILIQSIQEQQEMIVAMQAQLDAKD